MEMEHAKEEFDERERAIKQKEDDIRQKYSQLEANMRNKEYWFAYAATSLWTWATSTSPSTRSPTKRRTHSPIL